MSFESVETHIILDDHNGPPILIAASAVINTETNKVSNVTGQVAETNEKDEDGWYGVPLPRQNALLSKDDYLPAALYLKYKAQIHEAIQEASYSG